MTRRRRAPLLVVGLLVVLVAAAGAAGMSLALHPAATGAALDPRIPNEQILIARGLSGVPASGQPTAPIAVDRVPASGQPTTPIAVDRVLTDSAATYVQFHTTASLGRFPDIIPTLFDDTGALMNYGGGAVTGDGTPSWARLLPAWFPWRPPPGLLRGVATLGPLPPTARAAVLRFPSSEMVRVPLNLVALRRVRAGPLVSLVGLNLRVTAARDTSLVLGFSPFGDARGATPVDVRGHVVPLQNEGSECGVDGFVDTGLSCRQVWTYPPQ